MSKKFIAVLMMAATATMAMGDLYAPPEAGAVVNGYQDSFTGTLSPDWVASGGSYSVANDVLTASPGSGDSHLFLTGVSYDSSVQEVLALVRPVGEWESGPDGVRGGVAINGDAGSSQAYNLLLRSKPGENAKLLDDGKAWGPSSGVEFNLGEWSWMRLVNDGSNIVQAKHWVAGTEEPTDWITWDRTSNPRTGFAGITAGTDPFYNSQLEVDYFLLKSPGLPAITVTPEPASIILLALTGLALRRR